MAYTSITVEGGLFPADLLDRIAAGSADISGQREADFGFPSGRRLSDEMQSAFSDIRKLWDAFESRRGYSRSSSSGSGSARGATARRVPICTTGPRRRWPRCCCNRPAELS